MHDIIIDISQSLTIIIWYNIIDMFKYDGY